MNNLEAYKELEMQLATRLESQYQYHMFNAMQAKLAKEVEVYTREVQAAYQILGKLMAYKLIDRDDERLDKKNFKVFKDAGIDKDDRFPLDLRKDTNYIPEWLFADIPYHFDAKLIAGEHIGKHVEGEYECDMVYPERDLEVDFRLITTPKIARDAVENIAKIFLEETGKKLNVSTIAEEAAAGYSRIYEISINNSVIHQYKIVGYVIVFRSNKDGLFHAKMIVKSKVFKYYYCEIQNGCKTLSRAIERGLAMGENLRTSLLVDYSKAIKEQQAIIRESKDKVNKLNQTKRALA